MAGQSEGRGNHALPFYHSANQPVPGIFYDNNTELHQSENFTHRLQLEQSQATTATTSVANLLIPNATISLPVHMNNASEASTSSSTTNLLPPDFLSQFISPLRMSTDVVSLSPVKLPVESSGGTNALVDFAQIGNIIGMSKFDNRHVPHGETAPLVGNSLASFTEISGGGSSEPNGSMQQQQTTASFVMFSGDPPQPSESSQPHAISVVTKQLDGAIPLTSSSRIHSSPHIQETNAIAEGADESQSATPQQYLLIQDGNGRMLCFPLVFCNGQSGNCVFCIYSLLFYQDRRFAKVSKVFVYLYHLYMATFPNYAP